jgi:peptide subunit release factor 1 (eRF1)
VAAISEAAIRELAAIRGEGGPITSCYLDVDGRRLVRHQDLEHELDRLLRAARRRTNGDASVSADLDRIARHVRGGFDRSRTRGLAIFACAADDLWRVIELPVRVRSQVVINQGPAVGQLEALLEDYERIGVLLADKQRARMFVFDLGELVERSELFDELPAAPAHQHVRHAASVAWQVFQEDGFTHLALGAPDPIASELEHLLHPYLRERLCGRLSVPVAASHAELWSAVEEIEHRVERQREATHVARLREAAAAGRRGVTGAGPVLAALAEHRVEHLLVSLGYAEPGWRCDACVRLAVVGPRCKACGATMVPVDDVVEEAVQDALARGVRVDVCIGNADLDVLGRIGALLRY